MIGMSLVTQKILDSIRKKNRAIVDFSVNIELEKLHGKQVLYVACKGYNGWAYKHIQAMSPLEENSQGFLEGHKVHLLSNDHGMSIWNW